MEVIEGTAVFVEAALHAVGLILVNGNSSLEINADIAAIFVLPGH
jgi:hypothetical protein